MGVKMVIGVDGYAIDQRSHIQHLCVARYVALREGNSPADVIARGDSMEKSQLFDMDILPAELFKLV